MERGILLSILILFVLLFGGIVLTYLINLLLVSVKSTPKYVISEILKCMNLKKDDLIVDLGSGDGRILIEAVKNYDVEGVGYEISPILNLIGTIKKIFVLGRKSRCVKLKNSSFFNANLSNAKHIYCNLNEKALEALFPKMLKQMKKESRLYTYESSLNMIDPDKSIELSNKKTLYVYSGKKIIR